ADFAGNAIRRISPGGEVETLAGGGAAGWRDAVGRLALFNGPDGLAVDADGTLYVADAENFRIRKVLPNGVVDTLAGSGTAGLLGGDAAEAMFAYPTGVAVGPDGHVYVADRRSHTVRKITPEGEVYLIAGNGHPGFADGVGPMSHLREPISVAVSADGTVYVADSGNHALRKITPGGLVLTVAGGRRAGRRDGVGNSALFSWPTGIAVDKDGYIYVCDSNNNSIRRVSPEGLVITLAGSGTAGSADGEAAAASFTFPTGITVADDGTVYIADTGNNLIRKISRSGGFIFAAGGRALFQGDSDQ
ncbi:MAG TPA: hypothetical protein ENJ37_08945, partial [Deltaproteobacteria bacterium]|nr:hypothetical protein [Deltaproteobacteria bacterium]